MKVGPTDDEQSVFGDPVPRSWCEHIVLWALLLHSQAILGTLGASRVFLEVYSGYPGAIVGYLELSGVQLWLS